MRQMLIGVLAAATWAVPLPTSGQRAAQPCADPGWLYVTVVATRGVWVETGAIDPLAPQENPPRLLDLCELDGVIQATPPESMVVAALLNGGARPGPGDEVPEFSRVSLIDRSGAYLTELFVEESVADICRALPDCVIPEDR